jgi:hypothetical protein
MYIFLLKFQRAIGGDRQRAMRIELDADIPAVTRRPDITVEQAREHNEDGWIDVFIDLWIS